MATNNGTEAESTDEREPMVNSEEEVAQDASSQAVHLGMRLRSVDDSDQPVFSNFTVVQGAPGTVFLDFGFLEPSVLPALARQLRSGGKVPEAISGRLACRVALGVDVAAQLVQQLNRHLQSLQANAQERAKPET